MRPLEDFPILGCRPQLSWGVRPHSRIVVASAMRSSLFHFVALAYAIGLSPTSARAQVRGLLPLDGIGSVVIHPIVRQHFVCLEHPAGQLNFIGDALGADCLILDLGGGPTGRFPSFLSWYRLPKL